MATRATQTPAFDVADEQLVRRLRTLDWPEPHPEVRERCWKQLNQLIVNELECNRLADHPLAVNIGEQHGYSRRRAAAQLSAVLGSRLAVAGLWARRDKPRARLSPS